MKQKYEAGLKQAREGLIRKGLMRNDEDGNALIDVAFEDNRVIIRTFLLLKEKKMDAAFENLAFIALALLNKLTELTEDETHLLFSMALANTEKWMDYLKRI